MGVYIKGVTIPEDCWHCAYEGLFPPCGTGAESDYKKTRHPDCPLVEVKEPHGRLIDADNGIDKDVKDYEFNGKYAGCTIQDMLDCAPTVIEAEGEEK